ncbi:Methionyl-tRNA formyltransferase [Piscirickettsia salmonis]|uniref:Methionyl-tRNA formyltransferase n=1 Tax=Piscirickettsia salmonis TaxID=1238 RepID=A0AAC8VKQ8_PISSA|nr:methionyl-tRNA formyltransferase [Piscirickettsia salmonis]ALB24275.1 methionyl-tRNA formyltransferase [Piscirickettsia salmonis]QGN97132.1 Methionyl-tRNA formyltransferase [Piscirickettsia salmonis]QGO00728.1 Methionyl-tRNA formyltransferase [Piscirickettsia salmonis]QGO11453.1 Methionyl-tRNA formyltransferase [Piscirickettsia salmonis]QGO18475.1 Methionyl-tRNA formyltransferase [Piscirickettsia salmonis]
MKSLKIVFAGTPEFAAEILSMVAKTSHQVIAVYSQPDRPQGRGRKLVATPVKQLAETLNIGVFQPESLKTLADQDALRALEPDLMIVAAYGMLLPEAVLKIPVLGCINVHTSLLPRWRGAAPIQRAIEAGDHESGVTIMQMDTGLDTGDSLAQARCAIACTDTSVDLYYKLLNLTADVLPQVINNLAENDVIRTAQGEQGATYARKLSKQEACLDWSDSAVMLDCKIRAFNPWPIAFSVLDGENVRIWQAKVLTVASDRVVSRQYEPEPGTIIQHHAEGIEVMTGAGHLLIQQLQLPGSKVLSAREVLNGKAARFAVGRCFGE